MKKYTQLIFITLLSLSLTSCFQSSTKKGTVDVNRSQLLIVSASDMTKGANKAYAKVLAEAKKNNTLNPDPVQLKRVRDIADRLIPQTKVFRKDAPKWQWEVNVIKSEQINAWCMPGGKIAFYTGIIDTLELNDAEIAAIMGHEIAHALREHGRERASHAQIQGAGMAVFGILTGVQGPGMDLAAMVMNVTMTLPNSRQHEVEADRMGVELSARAGFDPYAAVNVWKKMKRLSRDAPPEFMSTHPSNESRIKDLTKYAKKVNHLYLMAKKPT